MSIANVTATELFESMTGYDEIAIGKAFGADPTELKGSMLGRAMIFLLELRGGLADAEAFDAAMKVTAGELSDGYFLPEDDEEAGKEQAPSAPLPTISLPSA